MANTAGDILLSLSNSLPQLGQSFSNAILQQNQLKRQAQQDQQDEEDRKRKAILDAITLQNAQQTNQKNALDIENTQQEIQRKNDALKAIAGIQTDQNNLNLAKTISGQDKISPNNYNGPFNPEYLSELGKMQEMKPLDIARNRLMPYGGIDVADKYVSGLETQQNRQDQIQANKDLKEMQIQQQQATIDAENKRHQETLDNELRIAGMKNSSGNFNQVADDFKSQIYASPALMNIAKLYAYGHMSEQETMAKVPGFNKASGPARLALTEVATEINPPVFDDSGNLIGGFNPKGFGISRKVEDQSRSGAGVVLNKQRMAAQRALSTFDDAYDKTKGTYQNIPDWMYRDLASDYAKILVASGQISEGGVDKIMQKSAKGAVVNLYNFVTGDTKTTAPDKVLTLLHDRIKALNTDLDKQYYNQVKGANINVNSNPKTNPLNNTNDNLKPHPQDDQAIQWAKSHPNDPRAAAILKANGL